MGHLMIHILLGFNECCQQPNRTRAQVWWETRPEGLVMMDWEGHGMPAPRRMDLSC